MNRSTSQKSKWMLAYMTRREVLWDLHIPISLPSATERENSPESAVSMRGKPPYLLL